MTRGEISIVEASIRGLQEAMTAGRTSARALTEAYLERIATLDRSGPRLNALICLNPQAGAEADALDSERTAGRPRGPLHGLPILIKDNYDMAGLPTTGSSLSLAGTLPPDDAFQVRRLREAGCVILGKTNLHEFAYGITCISSLGGQTLNPYALDRNPGGSSGGTAAAIAASLAAFGMGSDTCGSIRIPASHNNLIGLRPTLGLSSRDGILPMSRHQDVAGPLTRTVEDLALALDATAGFDPNDPTTEAGRGRVPQTYTAFLDPDALRGARVGVLDALFGNQPEDEEVASLVRRALGEMAPAGAEIVEAVSVPDFERLLAASSVLMQEFRADVDAYLARTTAAPYRSLASIVASGLYHNAVHAALTRSLEIEGLDSDDYRGRLAARAELRTALLKVLDEMRLDALAYPTIRRKAQKVGLVQPGTNCQTSAQSGLPAISFPAGFTEDGLPVGIELLGRPFDEGRLISLAFAHGQTARHRRPPEMTLPPPDRQAVRARVRFAATARGAAPFRVAAGFGLHAATRRLEFELALSGAAPEDITGAYLHRREGRSNGPVVHVLADRGFSSAAGSVELSEEDAAALGTGHLYIGAISSRDPRVQVRADLALSPPPQEGPAG